MASSLPETKCASSSHPVSIYLTLPFISLLCRRLRRCCRNAILAAAARDLEFGVHQLVRSAGGYRDRAAARTRAIKALARCDAAWQTGTDTAPAAVVDEDIDLEEAREAVEAVRRECLKVRKGWSRDS